MKSPNNKNVFTILFSTLFTILCLCLLWFYQYFTFDVEILSDKFKRLLMGSSLQVEINKKDPRFTIIASHYKKYMKTLDPDFFVDENKITCQAKQYNRLQKIFLTTHYNIAWVTGKGYLNGMVMDEEGCLISYTRPIYVNLSKEPDGNTDTKVYHIKRGSGESLETVLKKVNLILSEIYGDNKYLVVDRRDLRRASKQYEEKYSDPVLEFSFIDDHELVDKGGDRQKTYMKLKYDRGKGKIAEIYVGDRYIFHLPEK